jgi:hypothetical protein
LRVTGIFDRIGIFRELTHGALCGTRMSSSL